MYGAKLLMQSNIYIVQSNSFNKYLDKSWQIFSKKKRLSLNFNSIKVLTA